MAPAQNAGGQTLPQVEVEVEVEVAIFQFNKPMET